MASSRAPAPAPLSIEKHRTASGTGTISTAPRAFSPETSPLSPPSHSRTSSSSSDSSSSSSPSPYFPTSGSRAATSSSPRNVYTHCGRHTDQYLFGGKGFGDMWRAITRKE